MWLFFLISWCAIQIHPTFVKGCNETNLANVEEIQKFQSIFPFLALKHEVFSVHGDKGDYIGELNCPSGLRQGWGEMKWSNGTLYGSNNIFFYSSGDRYYGQWESDLQEGTVLLI